ncbi:hypothetical protein PENTCL1PPCAC_1661, partial [Pristionchus entomophagus]
NGVAALYVSNMSGMADIAVRLHTNAPYEVIFIIGKWRQLVEAAQEARGDQSDLPCRGLYVPFEELRNALERHSWKLIHNPDSFQFVLVMRQFVLVTLPVIAPREFVDRMRPPPQMALQPVQHQVRMTPFGTDRVPYRRQVQQSLVVQPSSSVSALPDEVARAAAYGLRDRRLLRQAHPQRDAEEEEQQMDMPATLPRKRDLPLVADDDDGSIQRVAPPLKMVKQEKEERKEKGIKKEKMGQDGETKKCDHCDAEIGRYETSQIQHYWKNHKEQVYKLIRPELVCSVVPYCDYVGSSIKVKKIHEARTHGKNPEMSSPNDFISDFEKDGLKCTYCHTTINRIDFVKEHLAVCTKRDERPTIGCSSCRYAKFHFLFDFITHLKKNGGATHGKPILL